MFVDYHMHTEYSDDSDHLMEDVVKDSIAIGLKEICFTDHVDYGVKPDHGDPAMRYYKGIPVLNVDYPNYFKDIAMLQEKYKGQIIIKKGLEFGIQSHTIHKFQKLFDEYPMDFVLLSIHQIEDKEFWLNMYQEGKTIEACYDGYYDEMYNVITKYKDFSCLAHMDLMRRYVDDDADYFEHSYPKIKKILKYLIENNKGIEVNTSHVRYGIKGITPSIEILKLYKKLGGTIITIGSDSHKKEHLGFLINESKDLLKSLGYTKFCTFDNMKPIFHDI